MGERQSRIDGRTRRTIVGREETSVSDEAGSGSKKAERHGVGEVPTGLSESFDDSW